MKKGKRRFRLFRQQTTMSANSFFREKKKTGGHKGNLEALSLDTFHPIFTPFFGRLLEVEGVECLLSFHSLAFHGLLWVRQIEGDREFISRFGSCGFSVLWRVRILLKGVRETRNSRSPVGYPVAHSSQIEKYFRSVSLIKLKGEKHSFGGRCGYENKSEITRRINYIFKKYSH